MGEGSLAPAGTVSHHPWVGLDGTRGKKKDKEHRCWRDQRHVRFGIIASDGFFGWGEGRGCSRNAAKKRSKAKKMWLTMKIEKDKENGMCSEGRRSRKECMPKDVHACAPCPFSFFCAEGCVCVCECVWCLCEFLVLV